MPLLRIINPATEELVTELETDTPETLLTKAAAARTAQAEWTRVPLSARLQTARRFARLLESERERLAQTLTSEMGKPITQSRNELNGMRERIDFFVQNTASALDEEVAFSVGAMEERIRYEPLGVVANISAWNYPYFVGSNVLLPALLAGNAVLYKPSEHATLTGLAMVELLHRAGVPPDALVPVIGAGDVGAALLDQSIDGIFFTGSYRTGQAIAEAVAGRLIRVQLELGGKDPAYVCDDVDVAAAAAAVAEGAFYNAGQSCCAVERVYVHRRIMEPFVDAFLDTVRGYPVGDPRDEATYLGPLAREPQLAVLEAQVRDAVERGAIRRCGGGRRAGRGYYFEPTVLTGVDHSMLVMREESFGPVIGIQQVEDDEAAVRLMNDTEHGLTAAVYTTRRTRAAQILGRMDTGTVYWNCCDRVSPRLPWSGRRHSGIGCTLGIAGIRAFVQPKAWHLNRAGGRE